MYILNGEKFKDYSLLHKSHPELLSFSEILKIIGCNYFTLNKIINENSIKPIFVECLPSGKKHKLYKLSDFNLMSSKYKENYKNDIIPPNYFSKNEFLEKLNISNAQFGNICFWCPAFNKSELFFVNNKKQRFYLYNETTQKFYEEKLNKYFKTNKTEKININNTVSDNLDTVQNFNNFRLHKTKIYKHHKIKLYKDIMNELFDTSSKYYKILINVYLHYSSQTIEDVSLYELHHIIPRFYVRNGNYFEKLNNMENLIYLPPNIHFLVHFLEYKCSLSYRNEFLSSVCIKTTTLNSEQIEEYYIDEITKLLIKAFYN